MKMIDIINENDGGIYGVTTTDYLPGGRQNAEFYQGCNELELCAIQCHSADSRTGGGARRSFVRPSGRQTSRTGVSPATTLEFSSIEAVKQCVMTGLGLTILPAVAVSTEIAQGRLCKLPWRGPDLTVVTHMVWHKDKWLSPALDAFLSLTREMLVITESD